MSSIFTFPVRDLRVPTRVTLVCFATSVRHEDDLLDELRRYCDENSPPDDVLLVGPSCIEQELADLRQSGRLKMRLPGASRYIDTPVIEQLCFDANGLASCNLKNVDKIVHAGMQALFHRHNGLILGSPAFHYIKPSGRHCDGFLRTANVLVRGVEIEFIAACCLSSCPAKMTRIYTDTGAIHSIAFAMLRLLSQFGDPRSECILDSFGSYTSMKKFAFLDAARSLVLISASTSGRLTDDLISHARQIRREHVTTVYYLGENATDQNVVCDLSFHPTDNPDGYALINSYPADSCPLCTGSAGVRMSDEQFMPQGPQVDPVLIVAKDAPSDTSAFFEPLVGRGVFRANYREPESSSASRELYLDLFPLFSTNLFDEIGGFHSTFDRFASHLVSANTKRIVHLNDRASMHFAGRIGAFANQNGVQINILSAKALQASSNEQPQQGGTTIVAASAISTGRGLTEVSKSLRFAQIGGAIKYVIAFSRTKNAELSKGIQRDLRFGTNDPREHSVSIMHEYFLPSWRPEQCTSWEDEFQMLSDAFNPPPNELDSRREALRLSTSADIRGLENGLFLPTRSNQPLTLRPSFAFWNFDYSEEKFGTERRPSQADVYSTIVAVLHKLRQAKPGSDNSLRQSDHVRRVISPRCFERFNDGIIQACFLRAAHIAELDYSIDDGLSEDMRSIIATILEQSETHVGEAANEFLLALARGRLRLCPTHIASLFAEFSAESKDPVVAYLWEKIAERSNINEHTG